MHHHPADTWWLIIKLYTPKLVNKNIMLTTKWSPPLCAMIQNSASFYSFYPGRKYSSNLCVNPQNSAAAAPVLPTPAAAAHIYRREISLISIRADCANAMSRNSSNLTSLMLSLSLSLCQHWIAACPNVKKPPPPSPEKSYFTRARWLVGNKNQFES